MSNQSNKEIQVVTNADFNGNEIKNAIIKNKQDTLVSGTNIKTINNQSILGSGNITIQGGGGGSQATLNIFTDNTGTTLDTHLELGNAVLIFKNGLGPLQSGEGNDYTINGSVITFTVPLKSRDKIEVINGDIDSIDLSPYAKTADLSNVALTGNYNDLSNKPTINDLVPTQTGQAGKYLTTDGSDLSWDNPTEKINNYTGETISDNFVLSVTSGDQKYFTPKDKITDIFSADKWELRFKILYSGKVEGFPVNAGVIATMGVVGGTIGKGFMITLDSNHDLTLRLSLDGESWNIFSGSVSNPIGMTTGYTYDYKLVYTGEGYYLYGKVVGYSDGYQLLQYVNNSAKISCGTDNNSATIMFGYGVDSADSSEYYQLYGSWFLKDCYLRLNDVQYDFTAQWKNTYKPDTVVLADYTGNVLNIRGNEKYITVSGSEIETGITISSCENSDEETYIDLTIASSPSSLSFTDNSGITWVGGRPTLLAGKTYQIVIINKVGYYKEI